MDPFSPQAVTGLNPGAAPATSATAGRPAVASAAGPSSSDNSPIWSPEHPLFWVGAIVAVTVGLIGVNSSLRIGKFKASVGAGSS